ncbi:hypothetical protein ACEPAF_4054 [Sanghuangporus sanghuang]
MAILGFFKKGKSKVSTSSQASSTSPRAPKADDAASSESYVLPPRSGLLPSVGNGDDGYTSSSASFVSAASSKKIRLPFSKKSSTPSSSPLTRPLDQPRKSFNFSSDKLSLSIDTSFDSPSLQSSVFPSRRESPSTPTLPRPVSNARPQPAPLQKPDPTYERKSNGGLFSWRERKKSKSPKPDPDSLVLPPLTDASFNLKSFRHVLPESGSESSSKRSPVQSPSSSSLVPPARPRGASVASTDSSQRISVAAFREAQARRSSTNLANGSPSPTIRPVSVAANNSAVSDAVPPRPLRAGRPTASPSPTPGRGGQPKPSRKSAVISSSSEISSSEESDSDDGSPSRPRSRLSRQRTITKRSYGARSDLGHGASRTTDYSHHQQVPSTRSEAGHDTSNRSSHASASPSRGPPPSAFPKPAEATVGTRSFSLYRRQRASYSTSELSPSAAAQRASAVADANRREHATAVVQRQRGGGDSDTSESSSESESSDEDAPLSALKCPKRPGSAFSQRSDGSSTLPRKPLIDLNTKNNPLSGKPIKDDSGAELPKGRKTFISPTDINSRLSQLTTAAGLKGHRSNSASRSEANLSSQTKASPKPSFADSAKSDSPASTTTIVAPPRLESLRPVTPGARRASVSALSEILDSSQSKASELRPVPVKDRVERDTGFRVVSRPQKSATSPPSFGSTNGLPQNAFSQLAKVSHQRQSSSSTFTVTSRPQNSIPPLVTKPLVASPQNESSVSGSSTSASFSASRAVPAMQKSPPQRPFMMGGKRQESPASSTGGSSNGKAPLTPMDGSDYFSPDVRGTGDSPASSAVGASPPSAMKGARGHLKRVSVSFQEPLEVDKDETVRGRKSGLGQLKIETQAAVEERESRLRERRRSEAKAAIELANVINGRGPLETDDDNEDPTMVPRLPPLNTGGGMGMDFNGMMQMRWEQQGMSTPMMGGMSAMAPLNGMPGMSMGMGPNPPQFMVSSPPPGADAAFLAAHRQAMQIAKQAYQYAVAQQAMAAAADEWERGSSVSAFTAPGPAMGMGMGSSMGMGGYGMNNMWNTAPMFAPAPRSMYAGNTGGMSETGWGAASVYGDAFGPSNRRAQMLNPQMGSSGGGGSASVIGFPSSYPRAESTGNIPRSSVPSSRNAPRPRTRTAPSNTPLPTQHRHSRGPPSSWKIGT